MKTNDLIKFFGKERGAKAMIARECGITAAAVTRWGADVPKGRAYDFIIKYPQLADFLANLQQLENQKAINKGFGD